MPYGALNENMVSTVSRTWSFRRETHVFVPSLELKPVDERERTLQQGLARAG